MITSEDSRWVEDVALGALFGWVAGPVEQFDGQDHFKEQRRIIIEAYPAENEHGILRVETVRGDFIGRYRVELGVRIIEEAR